MSNKNGGDSPSKKEVMAMFSIVAIFVLALALAIASIMKLVDGKSTIAEVLQAVALSIAVAVVAINSIDVGKKIKSKFWFWAWVISLVICAIFLVLMFVGAFKNS